MKIKILNVTENIKEKDFPKYLYSIGFKCKKIKSSNLNFVSKCLGRNIKDERGLPDFYIYNDTESFLCEFKSLKDAWQIHQIEWVLNHQDIPYALAIVSKSDIAELEIDTDFMERLKAIKNKFDKIDTIIEKYISEHPEVNGKEGYMNSDGQWIGTIPEEPAKQIKDLYENRGN